MKLGFKRHWKHYLLTTISLWANVSLHADPVKNVTYDQFTQLVHEKTAQIPELQNLWGWYFKHPQEPVYLGGGILRGLLRWLEENLRDKSFETVRQMQPPGIQQLLVQKDADRDLYHDNVGSEWFQEHFPEYGNWDILTHDFRIASAQAGGPGIEKLRINPNTLDDPYGGLRAFFNGELNYIDVPESDFAKFRGNTTALKGNYKIALVLRELRFANDLPSAKITKKTHDLLRTIVESEREIVKPGNYWIQKALSKFHKSTGGDIQKTLKTLEDYGLTETLAKNAYSLGDWKSNSLVARHYLLLELLRSGQISTEALHHFKTCSGGIAPNTVVMICLLERATTASQILDALSPGINNPNNEYLNLIRALMHKYFERFIELGPSPQDIQRFKASSGSIEPNIKLMTWLIERATTASQMLDALTPGIHNPNQAYLEKIQELMHNSIERFIELGPSPQDIQRFKASSNRIDSHLQLMRSLMTRTKLTPQNVLNILSYGISNPTERYLNEVSALAFSYWEHFLKLSPSIQELSHFTALIIKTELKLTVTQTLIDRAQTPPEFLTALELGSIPQNWSLLDEVSQIARKNRVRFLKLRPTDSELHQYDSHIQFSLGERAINFCSSLLRKNPKSVKE